MAIKNTCTPDNIYGPMEHTMFLGCSVSSFSTTLGWNEQGSSLSVILARDTCTGMKKYYDATLTKQTWTDADPGFIGSSYDIIGVPVYFRVDDFEYCGIVQSWEEQTSSDGEIYNVQITDPRLILEGTQCIINDFAGAVTGTFDYGPYNLFNIYGYMESIGVACPQYSLNSGDFPDTIYYEGDIYPDGPTFGAEAGGFGGAATSDAGMPWYKIAYGLDVLCNSIPAVENPFSPHGRVAFRGATIGSWTNGFGLIASEVDPLGAVDIGHSGRINKYFVDLTEIPTPPNDWRANGTSMSIMDMVNQLCTEYGYDYYVELLPVGSPTNLFIKVRVVNRDASPSYGQIQVFLNNVTGYSDRSIGVELRNEETSALLMGGYKQSIYQMYSYIDPEGDGPSPASGTAEHFTADDITLPYFGVDSSGCTIIPGYNTVSGWHINVETYGINKELQHYAFTTDIISIEELELRATYEGIEEWMSMCSYLNTDCGALFNNGRVGKWAKDNLKEMMTSAATGRRIHARDLVATLPAVFPDNQTEVSLQQDADIESIFNWVSSFAQNFSQKFQVRVPFTCSRLETTNNRVMNSEDPSDGGWTDQSTVLELPVSGTAFNSFILPDGRLGNFAVYTDASGINISELPHDSYIIEDDQLYMKVDIEPNYVFHYVDPNNVYPPQFPRIVCTVPAPVHSRNSIYNKQIAKRYSLIYDMVARTTFLDELMSPPFNYTLEQSMNVLHDIILDVINSTGGRCMMVPLKPPLYAPKGWALGIKSNVLRYGPWIARGPSGRIRVEKDDSLVPWEYNGMWALEAAATQKASSSLTYMQKGEKGHITIPGYPTIPLGAELTAVNDGYIKYLYSGRGLSYTTKGIYDCYYVDMTHGGYNHWLGVYGPNVTDISVSVGSDGIKTTYNMSTFTKRIGRFAKYNSERLRRHGSLSIERNARWHRENLKRMNRGFWQANRVNLK